MKYYLRVWAIGTHPEIEISEDKFEQLRIARDVLSAALAIEEKYELLISNYLDLERECLATSATRMVKFAYKYDDFFEIRSVFNRRVVNLLTSTRLYIDQISHHVKNCLPDVETVDVKCMFAHEYDHNFEYRFMEALRNYVQHRGLAVHSVPMGSSWESSEERGQEEKLVFTTELYTHKSEVESDRAFKKQVANEMPDKVNLIGSSRSYVESISRVHVAIRKLIQERVDYSRELVSAATEEYKAANDGKALGLHAIKAVPATIMDDVVTRFPLLLDWDDIRIDLIMRNQSLINLSKRCVSNSSSS